LISSFKYFSNYYYKFYKCQNTLLKIWTTLWMKLTQMLLKQGRNIETTNTVSQNNLNNQSLGKIYGAQSQKQPIILLRIEKKWMKNCNKWRRWGQNKLNNFKINKSRWWEFRWKVWTMEVIWLLNKWI